MSSSPSQFSSRLRTLLSFLGSSYGILFLIQKYLLPLIAQVLLNRSTIKIITGSIEKPSESAFRLNLDVQIENSGPLSTIIKYTKPLQLLRIPSTSTSSTSIPTSTSAPASLPSPSPSPTTLTALPIILKSTSDSSRKKLQSNLQVSTTTPQAGRGGGGKEVLIASVVSKNATSLKPNGGKVKMETIVTVAYDQIESFGSFSKELVASSGEIKQILRGDGVSIELFGGLIKIDGLSINKQVSLKGLGGLLKTEIHEVNVLGGTIDYMILEADTSIFNPSNVALSSLGDVYCSMHYLLGESTPLSSLRSSLSHATIIMSNLSLRPGNNRFKCRVNFHIEDQPGKERAAALQILSNFICCKATKPILLKGHQRKATRIPYLFDSLTNLNILASMPGMDISKKMIKSAVLLLSSPVTSVVSASICSKMQLVNSFSAKLTILRMTGLIQHKGETIATIDEDLSKRPISLEPHSITWSPQVWLKLTIGLSAVKALFDFDIEKGILKVDVDASLDCMVGDYLVRGVKYVQAGLETSLAL